MNVVGGTCAESVNLCLGFNETARSFILINVALKLTVPQTYGTSAYTQLDKR